MSAAAVRKLHEGEHHEKANDREYFETLDRYAERHWWHVARRRLAVAELARAGARGGAVAADIGCGIGRMLPDLRGLGARTVFGADPSPDAIGFAATGGGAGAALAVARAECLPLAGGSLSALVSMDVVEHIADEDAVLREYERVLAPGGVMLLQVPAYQWLWSSHDELVGHVRRYTASRLERAVRRAGFTVERLTYFHAWLLPLAALIRRTPLQRLISDSGESASYVNPAVNAILSALCRIEAALLRVTRLPFGVSVLLVARKLPAPGRGSL